jgi:hypothetical protein
VGGGITSAALGAAYTSTLVDELGCSEAIVAALPPDSAAPVPSA